MNSEEKIEKKKRKNIIIYIIYKIFAYDLLFFYAISMIFLNNYKGLSFAQIVFADSFFPFFKVVFQIPATLFIEKYGKRTGLIVGNLSLIICILFILGCNSLIILLLANIMSSIGYSLKNSCESNILYDSLPPSDNKQKIFSKIDGRSSALFYAFDSLSSILSGFLYTINPYTPMVLSLVCCIVAFLLSYQFTDVPEDISNVNEEHYKPKSTSAGLKHYIRNLKNAFKFIFSSGRLKSLIFYNAFFMSLLYLTISYRRSMLSEIKLNSKTVGIIFAVLGIFTAISAAKSVEFNKKFGNRTLTNFGIYYIISIFISSIVIVLQLPINLIIPVVLIMYAIQFIIKGPYQTLIKQYLSSFSQGNNMRIKIMSASNLIEGAVTGIVTLIGSILLNFTDTAHASIGLAIVSLIIIIIILHYMKSRVGLQPEQYPKNDIYFKEVK